MAMAQVPPSRVLSAQIANMLEGIYEARELGDVDREQRLQDQIIQPLVWALTSGDDDLLELSVYCISLLDKAVSTRALSQAHSASSRDLQISESVERVARLSEQRPY